MAVFKTGLNNFFFSPFSSCPRAALTAGSLLDVSYLTSGSAGIELDISGFGTRSLVTLNPVKTGFPLFIPRLDVRSGTVGTFFGIAMSKWFSLEMKILKVQLSVE